MEELLHGGQRRWNGVCMGENEKETSDSRRPDHIRACWLLSER